MGKKKFCSGEVVCENRFDRKNDRPRGASHERSGAFAEQWHGALEAEALFGFGRLWPRRYHWGGQPKTVFPQICFLWRG